MTEPGRRFEKRLIEEHGLEWQKAIGEQKFQAIADIAVDAIVSINADSKITFWNKAAEAMFDYKRDEVLGKDLTMIMPERYRLRHKRGVKRFSATKRTDYIGRVNEFEGLRRDGTEFPLQLSVATWGSGGKMFFLSIVRDTTTQRRASQLSNLLNVINIAMASSLDTEVILKTVVEEAAKGLGSESATIVLHEGDGWEIKYTYGLLEKFVGTRLSGERAKHIRAMSLAKKSLVIQDTHADLRVDREFMKELGTRSLIMVPLVVKDEIAGALVFHCTKIAPFGELEIDFANKLGSSLSLAIENSRLYQAQRHTANTLQEAMLVTTKKIEGIDFDFIYRSATETLKVGGDFYDIFELEHDKTGIVIGDVSGKGLEAATLTSVTKNSIKAYAYESKSPAEILRKTNEIIARSSEENMFVTIFFAILENDTGKMIYSNAGHPPPIIKDENYDARFLKASSPAIGMFTKRENFSRLEFNDETDCLAKEDLMVLYTDGVIETRCQKKLFGDERLISLVSKNDSKSPKMMNEQIFKNVLDFCGDELADDLVLLSIRRMNKP